MTSNRQAIIAFLLYLMHAPLIMAQKSDLNIAFFPKWEGQNISRDHFFQLSESHDSIQFSVLRFYISRVHLKQDGKPVVKDSVNAHLVDLLDTAQNTFTIHGSTQPHGNLDLCFTVGLDSLLNTNGIQNGDLDPVNGMYWTWQSGFIHLKVEGYSSEVTSPDHGFQFHIGGYRTPYVTAGEVCLSATASSLAYSVDVDFSRLFREIRLSSTHHLMSPGKDAFNLAEQARSMFYLSR